MPTKPPADGAAERAQTYFNRELSWLGFSRRVLSRAARESLPLLDRVKFAGIVGMLHDEFFMKRMSGLKREVAAGVKKLSIDGRQPSEELAACREELLKQQAELDALLERELFPALRTAGLPILRFDELSEPEREHVREYYRRYVQPILTPLAVDKEHPFPFISNHTLNLVVLLSDGSGAKERYVRIEVPANRPRFVPLPARGVVPLEQVIAANLDLLYPQAGSCAVHGFRITRGVEGERVDGAALEADLTQGEPGDIIHQVSSELKARRFAGVVRLQVDASMPKKLVRWLAKQLGVGTDDVYPTSSLLGLSDLQSLETRGRDDLRLPLHEPVTHPRLARLDADHPAAFFAELARGDVLLHHPYHSFDSSVLRFLQCAAADPSVLAIRLTIYRTSSDSPIVAALVEAARRGKQVAVIVEVTARFDEAPNIAWGTYLQKEGVNVCYGVEQLKTHVKLALVVREEPEGIRRYAHIGTGNYHAGTARIYEDLGLLTTDPVLCAEVAAVLNWLTGAVPYGEPEKLIVGPAALRRRFTELIRREAEHAKAGRLSGIRAKMNQLHDSAVIRELYAASRAGVPITLDVRGLCCLRPGVPELSETIRVFSVVGRFLEHSRIFRFENGGAPEHFIGSADWMKRNLDARVETVVPIESPVLKAELDQILSVYERDNCSVWDCQPDGVYVRRAPGEGEEPFEAQAEFIRSARAQAEPARPRPVLTRRASP